MVRRAFALVVVGITMLSLAGVRADAPVPELGVVSHEAGKVLSGTCAAESAFDVNYGEDGTLAQTPVRPDFYRENCVRLKVVFGPIWMKPGQNDVLIQPVTFEKPLYDGYITRFKPDMVSADPESGVFTSPRVKDAHLHHGTWLNPGYFGSSAEYFDVGGQQVPNPGRTYGRGPWIASGEEKTIAIWPEGFGLKVKASDAWLFLHMIHNATAQTYPVWVTYDLDYIPADAAEAPREWAGPDTNLPNLINTQGIWLDVGDCSWSSACEKDSFNPIFNVQRGFNSDWQTAPDVTLPGGETVPAFSRPGACVFPAENCAMINTLAETSAQQGVDIRPNHGKVYDEITINQDGTLVMMGGHLHNGGLRDDVYLVRNGEAKLIHISDAYYFDHGIDWDEPGIEQELLENPLASKIGAPPVSWDFVMTGVTSDLGWNVQVKAGDKIRLEGIYDSSIASWYEQMGIVMTWFVPAATKGLDGNPIGAWGLDPFDPDVQINEGVNTMALQPGTMPGVEIPGAGTDCTFGSVVDGKSQLCVRGQMTHPRIPSSGDHFPITQSWLPITGEQQWADIPIGGFGYGPADNGIIRGTGMVPTVELGESVRFWNLDTADYMWHTVTRCKAPCTATTSASYPLADGAYDDLVDGDGLSVAGMKLVDVFGVEHTIAGGLTVSELLAQYGPDPMDFDSGQIGVGTGANNKLDWEWTPSRTGTFSFYCRIHPPMRGAIRVVDNV